MTVASAPGGGHYFELRAEPAQTLTYGTTPTGRSDRPDAFNYRVTIG